MASRVSHLSDEQSDTTEDNGTDRSSSAPCPSENTDFSFACAYSTAKNDFDDDEMNKLLSGLRELGIQAQKTNGRCPPEAIMHDRAAPVPALVVSPLSEWGVMRTLELFNDLKLHRRIPISVKSGGHGYHNGASCSGVMLNLGRMSGRQLTDDTLFVEPGCLLGQLVPALAKKHKAIPHGDCFGVGAGGHFTTAGWDLLLARRYGLGCQSVVGGRVVLWDGSVIDVDEQNHPDLLFAMRGGAAAGVGVVTEIRLRLLDEPPRATWRFTRITEDQLRTCVSCEAFANAAKLPNDISVSFRFHFEPDQYAPVCSFNIVSLLTADETIRSLEHYLGAQVTSLVADLSEWNEKTLVDLRMLPASELLAANPEMLSEVCSTSLHENPLFYWKRTSSSREMARSFFTSISHWVMPNCDLMLLGLFQRFQSAQSEPARGRMYALVIHGGGRMLEEACSMPLGQTLARFELHWDDPKERQWCQDFTDNVADTIKLKADSTVDRPYRGDIWLKEQEDDPKLNEVFTQYDRRLV